MEVPGWPGWVQPPALDFGSGHDLMVCGIEPCVGLHGDSAESAWDSPSLSTPPLLALSLFQNK